MTQTPSLLNAARTLAPQIRARAEMIEAEWELPRSHSEVGLITEDVRSDQERSLP